MAANCAPWLSHCCLRLWGREDGGQRGSLARDSSRSSQDSGLQERLVVPNSSRASSLDLQDGPSFSSRLQVASMPVMLCPPIHNTMPSAIPATQPTAPQGPGSTMSCAGEGCSATGNHISPVSAAADSAFVTGAEQGSNGNSQHGSVGVFKRWHLGWGAGVGPPARSSSSPSQVTPGAWSTHTHPHPHPHPHPHQHPHSHHPQQQHDVGSSRSLAGRMGVGRSSPAILFKGGALQRSEHSATHASSSAIEVELKEGQAGPGLGVGYLEEGGRPALVQARI